MARLSVAGAYPLAAGVRYLIGCGLALGAWSIIRYVPDKPIALLLLGVTPFMARLMPKNIQPDPDSIAQVRSTASSAWA